MMYSDAKGALGRSLLIALVMLVGLLPACEKKRTWDEPGPDQVFRDFLNQWYANDREKAFEMVDPEDRRTLEKPLEELKGRYESVDILESKEMLVAGRVDNPYDVKSIEVVPKLESKPEPGERFRLKLTYQDGRSGSAKMVWREERWYVDLPLDGNSQRGDAEEAFGEPSDPSNAEDAGGSQPGGASDMVDAEVGEE